MNRLSPFEGTESEFEQLVERHKLLLYSVVYGVSRDSGADADDIVQETFIYAFFHYGELRDKGRLAPWLCAIARNKARDSSKARRKMVSIDIFGQAAGAATPEAVVLGREKKNRLTDEIAALPEIYRETVLLFYFASKTTPEIAEILSIPEGTVKFRLHESRKKLKKELRDLMDEEKQVIENRDIYTKIREGAEEAFAMIRRENHLEASKLCDEFLTEATSLTAKTREELEALSLLYSAKANSVRYAEGFKAAIEYIKKTVEIAEQSGDNEWISSKYSYYAVELSNLGQKDESEKYYKLALQKAEETGNPSIISDRLYWNGIRAYENKESDFGLSYFNRVLNMKDTLIRNKNGNGSNVLAYTLAYSAAAVLKDVGEKISKLECFDSTAPSIKLKDGGLSLGGQPGYGGSAKYEVCDDIFYEITRMEPFLSDKIQPGHTFEQNVFSYSFNPVRSRYEVVATDETVTVPAGTFDNCLHTRYVNIQCDDNKINKWRNGTRDIWYAPNMGVIKHKFVPIEGEPIHHQLKEYHTEYDTGASLPELFLPLKVGNKWSYTAFTPSGTPADDEIDYANFFEVTHVLGREAFSFDYADCEAFIAHSGWAAKKL